MDLSKLDVVASADNGATLVVQHPITREDLLDSKGQPVTITLLGSDSSVLRNEMKARAKRQLDKRIKPDLDDAIKASSEMLAVCTIGWSGIEDGGVALQCDKATITQTYMKYPWLREQVDAFVSDRENFYSA